MTIPGASHSQSLDPSAPVFVPHLFKSSPPKDKHDICVSSPSTNNVNYKSCQIIASVADDNPALPIILVQLNKQSFPFLLDTGSSVSIVDNNFFSNIKSNIKARYLSRSVKISTVNSEVKFLGCVEFIIKISNKNFKHNFYIISLQNHTKFVGILGFDFITKFNIQIKPESNLCTFKDLSIPFVQYNLSSQQYQCNVNIKQCTNSESDEKFCIGSIKVARKITIQPQQSTYIKAYTELSLKSCEDLVFEPAEDGKFECESAVYSFPNTLNRDDQICPEKVQRSDPVRSFCYIFVKNNTKENIHINKGMKMGKLYNIHEIKVPFDTKKTQDNLTLTHPITSTNNNEYLNVITPSPEIINKRKLEFSLNDFKLQHLSQNEQNQLTEILSQNFQVFSKSLDTLGHTDRVIPQINFTNKYPIKCLPFPIPYSLQEEAKKQINELIEAGIIRKNLSSWACPMLLVRKKSIDPNKVAFRLALDLRLLNSIIEPISYPLPRINTLIAQLAKFKFFTCLDMPSAYHQIDLPEKYQDYLSFATPWSTFCYNRLCFGLKNASGYFQSFIDLLIEECNMEGILSYQDDIIIGANSFEDTCKKLKIFLEVCKKHNVTLFAQKCSFHQTEVKYLGFQISQNKIYPITTNISKITSFPTPKTKKQVKQFLGVCGYYRSLIPSYAKLTDPLIQISCPKSIFKWQKEQEDAFNTLQNIFFHKPFLCQPDFSKEFFVNTDASKTAISAILMQQQGNKLLPISYFSKSLKKAEQNYPPIKLELLAIVKGIEAFKYYLYGKHFTIISDSQPLKHYKKVTSPSDITTNWLLKLSEYDYSFQHIPGKINVLADFFSRTSFENNSEDLNKNPNIINSNDILPIINENLNTLEDNHVPDQTTHIKSPENNTGHQEVDKILKQLNNIPPDPLLQITEEMILLEQLKDKQLSKIYTDILNNNKSQLTVNYFICPTSRLLRFARDPSVHQDAENRIALPRSLQAKAIRISHIPHFGILKTYQQLSKFYYWRGCYADVINFVRSCPHCNAVKSHVIPSAPFMKNPFPNHPGDYISLDLVGPFKNQQYILTVIDHFSRFLVLYPLRTISSSNIVESLFDYITVHGRPSQILTDLGSQFTSNIFQQFTNTYGIKLMHTTVSHPQANSISERINSHIKSTIIALQQEGHNFYNAIKIHQMLYNSSVHSSTKFSPNYIHFGREISTLFDTFVSRPQLRTDMTHTYFQIMQDLQQIYDKVYSNLAFTQQIQNQRHTIKAKLRDINEGDQVYLKSNHKFNKQFIGPFTVIKKVNAVNFEIQRSNNSKAPITKVHIDRLWIAPRRKHHLESATSVDHHLVETSENINVPETENIGSTDSPPNQLSNNFSNSSNSISGGHQYSLRPRKIIKYR